MIRNFSDHKIWVLEPTPNMATARILLPGMQSPMGVDVIGFKPHDREVSTNGVKGNFRVTGCLADVINYGSNLACIGKNVRPADTTFGIYAHDPNTVWGIPCQAIKPPNQTRDLKRGDAAQEYDKLIGAFGLDADSILVNKDWRKNTALVQTLMTVTQKMGSPLNFLLRLAVDHAEKKDADYLWKQRGEHSVTHVELNARKGSGSEEIASMIRANRLMEYLLYDLNANDFLSWMTSQLLTELREIGTEIPEDLFVGNFPMKSFNAQARRAGKGFLVLIESGIFDLLERLPNIIFRETPDSERRRDFAKAIIDFCKYGQTPSIESVDHPSLQGEGAGSVNRLISQLITAAEEFIISHEVAHCVLGHLQDGTKSAFPIKGTESSVEIISKSEFQEHQADLWAAEKLYLRSRRLGDPESAALLAHGGAIFALGLGGIIESYRMKFGELKETGHPRAAKRIYMIDRFFYLRCKEESSGELGQLILNWINDAAIEILGSELEVPLYDVTWNSLVEDIIPTIGQK